MHRRRNPSHSVCGTSTLLGPDQFFKFSFFCAVFCGGLLSSVGYVKWILRCALLVRESESIGSFVPLVHVLLCGLLSLLQKDDLLQGAFGTQANFPHIYHLWWLGWNKQPTTFQLLYIQVFDLCFSHGMPRANPIPNDLFTSKIRIFLNDLWIECPTIKQQLHQTMSTTSTIKLLVPGKCRHGDLEFFQHPQCRPMLSASGRKPVSACSLVEPRGFSFMVTVCFLIFIFRLQAVWCLLPKSKSLMMDLRISQKQVGDDG